MSKKIIIAIASHKRPEQLQNKTLSLLKKHKFNMKDVYIFSSTESMKIYKPIAKKWGFNLIKSKNNILDTRNHMIQSFPNGTRIVELDDDVEDILTTKKGEVSKSVKNLKKLFNDSFKLVGKNGLWGFNANTNTFFAKGVDKFGLYSIINSCLGYINDKSIKLTVSEKEDFERGILFYQKAYPILKRTGYGIKTNYWKNKGGIQDRYGFEKRKQVQKQSADNIMTKYPGVCFRKVRENGIVDIRFKPRGDPLKIYKKNKDMLPKHIQKAMKL